MSCIPPEDLHTDLSAYRVTDDCYLRGGRDKFLQEVTLVLYLGLQVVCRTCRQERWLGCVVTEVRKGPDGGGVSLEEIIQTCHEVLVQPAQPGVACTECNIEFVPSVSHSDLVLSEKDADPAKSLENTSFDSPSQENETFLKTEINFNQAG